MFYEKLLYYRKKKMLSQEELADVLHVSRQTITKWESGQSLPNLEYLIHISKLFGVTIDSLVKEDDCKREVNQVMEVDTLAPFLVQAKRQTYAAKKGKMNSFKKGYSTYGYQEDNYQYTDTFVGSSLFSGQEVVSKENEVIWSMNYYGRVLGDGFDGDFLKEALLRVPVDKPYRGEELYSKGDFCYCSYVEGDITCFKGREEIFYQHKKVYTCLYHGGMIG